MIHLFGRERFCLRESLHLDELGAKGQSLHLDDSEVVPETRDLNLD